MDYSEYFINKGLTPLETPKVTKQKVECVDKEGYKYLLTTDQVKDSRTNNMDRWTKRNPFKPYNMRLYASQLDPKSQIVSTDEELRNATTSKIKFICPECGKIYEKKWCHWISQDKGKHTCPQCSYRRAGDDLIWSEEKLRQTFEDKGYKLLSTYEDYLNNGMSKARLCFQDKVGYKYYVCTNVFLTEFSGTDKFNSRLNPYAKENLELWCKLNNVDTEVIEINENSKKPSIFKCSCGNIYETKVSTMMGGNQRCPECTKQISSYALKAKQWLEQNNIQYDTEVRFDDCRNIRPLPFDFVCEYDGKVIAIEVDGGQHYYENNWFDQSLEERQRIDQIKTDYCKKKGYTLLRLPFWHFQNGTYQNYLSKTFFNK